MDISPVYTCWSIFCWISKGNSYRSPSCFLCADLYSPGRCFFLVSLNSQLASLQLKMYVGLHMSSFSVSCPGPSLRAQCAWPVIGSNSCFLSLLAYSLLLLDVQQVANGYFIFLSLFSCCFRWQGESIPHYFIMIGSGNWQCIFYLFFYFAFVSMF